MNEATYDTNAGSPSKTFTSAVGELGYSASIHGILDALGKINEEITPIGKDSRNETQRYDFRGIDAVMNHLHPLFAKHGVIVLSRVLNCASETREYARDGGKSGTMTFRVLTIAYRFVAVSDGTWVESTVLGEGADTGDKASPKCMAIALKYVLSQMLLLPYDEIDPDGDTPPDSKAKAQAPAQAQKPATTQAAPTPQAKPSAPAKAQAATSDGEQTTEIILDPPKKTTGTNKQGKPYTKYSGKGGDGETYQTFDTRIGDDWEANAGMVCSVTYEIRTNGRFTDRVITSLAATGDTSASAKPAVDPEQPF